MIEAFLQTDTGATDEMELRATRPCDQLPKHKFAFVGETEKTVSDAVVAIARTVVLVVED